MTEALTVNDTARLSIELMSRDDADLLFELDQDPEVMRYINGGKMTSRKDLEEKMIPRMEQYRNTEKGWGLWKVIVKDNAQFIGWILVRPMAFFSDQPELENLELGWRFKQESWGKGYATEAAKAVMQALTNKGGITQLSAIAMPGNTGSINIMKKLGMTYIKTYIHEDPLGDLEAVYYSKQL